MVRRPWFPDPATEDPSTEDPATEDPAKEAVAATTTKREQDLCLCCPKAKKPLMGRHLYPVVGLSTICLLLLVTSVALVILYYKEADSKPECKSLLSDYQNISDRYLALAKANKELKRENQHLKEHNARLDEQTKLLNRSSAKLMSMNHDLASESARLQQQITNLTSVNLQLVQEQEQLVQHSTEQEERNANMSQTIARLIKSHAELGGERQNLSETNAFLRLELFQVKQKNRELVELNDKFQGEIQNQVKQKNRELVELNDKFQGEIQNLRDECEAVVRLREQNRNLSRMLEEERSDAEEFEQSTNKEMEQKGADLNSLKEAYNTLDLYCPVVDRQTKERVCKKCPGSWRLFDTKCYYISTRLLTWDSSRAWCQTQGGDLLVVNSDLEQRFIFASSHASKQTSIKVWIGMTDAQKEGDWRWVDGSTVTSDTQFWLNRPGGTAEPDNWKQKDPQGENCGHIDTAEKPLNTWMDASCKEAYSWICEKNT